MDGVGIKFAKACKDIVRPSGWLSINDAAGIAANTGIAFPDRGKLHSNPFDPEDRINAFVANFDFLHENDPYSPIVDITEIKSCFQKPTKVIKGHPLFLQLKTAEQEKDFFEGLLELRKRFIDTDLPIFYDAVLFFNKFLTSPMISQSKETQKLRESYRRKIAKQALEDLPKINSYGLNSIERVLSQHLRYISRPKQISLLQVLKDKNRLSNDLAQKIFCKDESLLTHFADRSLVGKFSNAETKALFTKVNLARAMNQARLVNNDNFEGVYHGFEIETYAFGEAAFDSDGVASQYSLDLSPLPDDDNNEFEIGYDGNCFEISLEDGFSLTTANRLRLYKLIRDMENNPGIAYFATNHLHLDAIALKPIDNFDDIDSIFYFRREPSEERPTWETNEVPSCSEYQSYSRNFARHPFFNLSRHFDQMQIISTLAPYETSNFEPCLSDFFDSLTQAEKRKLHQYFFEDVTSDFSQKISAKILITIAKNTENDFLIPAILRSYQAKTIPRLSSKIYEKVTDLLDPGSQGKFEDLAEIYNTDEIPIDYGNVNWLN